MKHIKMMLASTIILVPWVIEEHYCLKWFDNPN